jgi:hypothetical protein
LAECQVPPFEFYFEKNGIENMVPWMPFHNMAWWALSSDDRILFLKDPHKKQLVGLVCSVKKLDDALAPTNAKKRFEVKKIKDLNAKLYLKSGSNSRRSLNWRGRTPKKFPKEDLNTRQ